MYKSLILFLISVLFPVSFLTAAAAEGKIKWPEVRGAGGYIAELKNTSTGEITRTELSVPEYQVSVPDGDYLFRVGVYNRFGKNPRFSNWTELKVRVSREPSVNSAPQQVSASDQKFALDLQGKNFLPDTAAFLVNKDSRYELQTESAQNGELKVSYSGNLPAGQYDLLLINPLQKTTRVPQFITIADKPAVSRLSILWRSSVLPGWGQYYAGNFWRAVTTATLFTAAAGYYVYSEINYTEKENTYLGLTGNVSDAAFRRTFLNARDEYAAAGTTQNNAFYILITVYALNLLDAAFLNGPYLPLAEEFALQPDFNFRNGETTVMAVYKF